MSFFWSAASRYSSCACAHGNSAAVWIGKGDRQAQHAIAIAMQAHELGSHEGLKMLTTMRLAMSSSTAPPSLTIRCTPVEPLSTPSRPHNKELRHFPFHNAAAPSHAVIIHAPCTASDLLEQLRDDLLKALHDHGVGRRRPLPAPHLPLRIELRLVKVDAAPPSKHKSASGR